MHAVPPRPTLVPNAIAFRDAQHGLLGTGYQFCSEGGPCFGGTISATDDGGRTFHVVVRTVRPVLRVQVAGMSAWAELPGGHVLRSADGGRTWSETHVPVVVGAVFATPLDGLALAPGPHDFLTPTAVVATHDGGRTWRPLPRSPCRGGLAFAAILSAATVRDTWIACVGQPGTGSQAKAVYRSRDGGRTWRVVARTVVSGRSFGGLAGYGYPQGLAVATDGFGVLWESRGTLYVSRDGGRSWTAEPHVVQPEVDAGRSGWVLPGGRGYVLVGRGTGSVARLLATRDAGRTWRVVHTWR